MCISRDGHVAASVGTGTEPPRQPATARRSGHRGTDACEGGHPGTAAGRRRTATPGCAQCRRCHPLLLRRANQGLRRGGRTQDREHPQHGDEPCGRVLRRHRAGQRAERRGGPGTLLARQHGGGDALQRTEERHLPARQGLQLRREHLLADADALLPRRRAATPEGDAQGRLLRHRQSRPRVGPQTLRPAEHVAQRRIPLHHGTLPLHLPRCRQLRHHGGAAQRRRAGGAARRGGSSAPCHGATGGRRRTSTAPSAATRAPW